MNEEQYIEKFVKRGIIGLCELCKDFKHCAYLGELKENGCNNHSNYNKE